MFKGQDVSENKVHSWTRKKLIFYGWEVECDREKGRNGDREVAGRGQNREICMKHDKEFEFYQRGETGRWTRMVTEEKEKREGI